MKPPAKHTDTWPSVRVAAGKCTAANCGGFNQYHRSGRCFRHRPAVAPLETNFTPTLDPALTPDVICQPPPDTEAAPEQLPVQAAPQRPGRKVKAPPVNDGQPALF